MFFSLVIKVLNSDYGHLKNIKRKKRKKKENRETERKKERERKKKEKKERKEGRKKERKEGRKKCNWKRGKYFGKKLLSCSLTDTGAKNSGEVKANFSLFTKRLATPLQR